MWDEICFIFKDGYTRLLLFVIPPIVMAIMCGMFIQGVPSHIPVAVVDYDHSALSRHVLSNIDATRSIHLQALPASEAEANHLMRTNQIFAYLEIPRGAESAILRNSNNRMAIRYNGQFRSQGTTANRGLSSAVSAAIMEASRNLGRGVHSIPSSDSGYLQVMSISNPQNSYERFLEPIAVPVVLGIALSAAVICAFGRCLKSQKAHQEWVSIARYRWVSDIVSRTVPYVMVFFGWHLIYWLWFTQIRGWPILGHAWLLMLGLFLFCVATAAIAVFLLALNRNIPSALGLSTIYTSSALTYSGSTLSIYHASAWTRFWTNALPFTHFYQLQLEQVNLGSDISISLHQCLILGLYIVIPLILAYLLFIANHKKPLPEENTIDTQFKGVVASIKATLLTIVKTSPITSTALASLVLYSVYYPSAYSSQIDIRLPVTVVNLDHSSLSRRFIDNLNSTQSVDVTNIVTSTAEGDQLLRNNQTKAVITINTQFERHIVRGENSGLLVQLSSGYMAMASTIRSTVSGVLAETRSNDSPPSQTAEHVISMPIYNPTVGYETFVMPLVFILILQQTLVFGGAMMVGLRHERGLSRLAPRQFIGTWLALTLVGILSSCFIFGVIYWIKDYPNEGSLFVQLPLILLFAGSVSALALLVGSFANGIYRPIQLFSCTSMAIFYGSGASFPINNMPDIIVLLMKIFPSTIMINGFEMLNSQGATAREMLPVAGNIIILGVLLFALAWWRLVTHPPR